MNNKIKIPLSILAGIETTFYMFTPIILASLWVRVFGFESFGSYLIYSIGLLSTLFRAIKIGWLR